MDPKVDEELIGLLRNTSLSVDVRSQGWKYIISLSATSDGVRHIINSGKYIPLILSCITEEKDEEFTKLAFKSLVNISSEERGTLAVFRCRKDICSHLLNKICDQESKFIEYKCYVLSNMSLCPDFLEHIVHILLSSRGLYEQLATLYCSSDLKVRNQYDFLILVFANVSKLSAGRRLFLQDSDFMNSIINVKSTDSESRRLGTALILRNCCLETEYHEKLLNNIGILPALLLPLMVPQQYEEGGEMGKLPTELQERCLAEIKERDKSLSVRRVLVEALTVLCYSEFGWRFLKTNGIYYVVRDLHAVETDEIAKEAIEQLVAYLLVVEYAEPQAALDDMYLNQDAELIKQLETDMTKDLPDFVI